MHVSTHVHYVHVTEESFLLVYLVLYWSVVQLPLSTEESPCNCLVGGFSWRNIFSLIAKTGGGVDIYLAIICITNYMWLCPYTICTGLLVYIFLLVCLMHWRTPLYLSAVFLPTKSALFSYKRATYEITWMRKLSRKTCAQPSALKVLLAFSHFE